MMQVADGVAFQEIEGEIVLLESRRGRCWSLDEVGTRVWQLLSEYGELESVVTQMLAEFEVDEPRLRTDVDALVRELRSAGLVVSCPAGDELWR
jgi:hypothetical protein